MEKDDEVRTRLRDAALRLFRERGYDQTTAAQIAARAGVTERTFFRYFPDKREVLFDGEVAVRERLIASIADAPTGLEPLAILFRAFRSFEPTLRNNWSYSKPRYELISATPALQERELTKGAALADALAAALQARDVTKSHAILAARIGMNVFVYATVCWLEHPRRSFGKHLESVFRDLKAILGDSN